MSDSDERGFLARVADGVLATLHVDSWANRVTGQGTGRDKRVYTEMELDLLDEEQEETLYRGSALHRRAVDLLPDECFRAGFEVRVPGEPEITTAINTKLSELDTEAKFWEAHHLSRLHGGALVVPGINNGDDSADAPLNLGAVRSVDFLNVFSKREATAIEYYGESNRRDYGNVSTYQVNPLMGGWFDRWSTLHASRAIRLEGIYVQRHTRQVQMGWGDGLYVSIHEAIRDWGSAYGSAAHLIHDAEQGILKMPGLTDLILKKQQEAVREKMAWVDMARSNMRTMLLGKDETFERVSTNFTGVDGALLRLDFYLSAVLGYPVTILLGQAPAGLNATGSADLETFRACAQAEQRRRIKPALERLVRLIFLSKKFITKGVEPKSWSIKFHPLSQPSAKEVADTRYVHAQTDQVRQASGTISRDEARSRLKGDEYRDEVVLDAALDEALPTAAAELELEQERLAAEAEQLAAGGTAPGPVASTPGTATAGAPKVADTALNGAQAKEARETISSVARKELSRDAGIGLLMVCLNLPRERAEMMMADVGHTFFVESPPPPKPFPGANAAAAPPPPQGKTADDEAAQEDGEGG